MTTTLIRECERRIAWRVIRDMLAAGYVLSVNDGEETVLIMSDKPRAVLGAMFSTDEDYLLVHRKGEKQSFGWVLFIYGNSGWDVVSDYTTNLEPHLAGANAIAARYE